MKATNSYGRRDEFNARLNAEKTRLAEATDRSQFGRTLQKLRLAQGLNTHDFAKRHGCTHQNIFTLECLVKSPTIATVAAVCKTLGITLTEFFTEYEKQQINLAEKIAAKLGQ